MFAHSLDCWLCSCCPSSTHQRRSPQRKPGGTVSGFRVSDVVAYDNPYQILSLRLNDQLVYRDGDRSRQQCRSAELRRNVSCDVLDGNGVVQVVVLQDVTTPRQVVASVIDENGDSYRGDRHQGDLAYLNDDDQIRNIQFAM